MAGFCPSMFFFDLTSDDERPHYFLDSCSLCKTPLHLGDGIYMYRGDTPFCSEACRQERIEIDEGKERKKKNKLVMLKKSLMSKAYNDDPRSQEIHVRATETVVTS